MIAAAAKNETHEDATAIVKLLMQRSPSVELIEEVLRGAAMQSNKELMEYLLDVYPI